MFAFLKSTKVKAVLTGAVILVLAVLYSYLVSDTVVTRITDAQMAEVDGQFMIATEYRLLVNCDAKYRF